MVFGVVAAVAVPLFSGSVDKSWRAYQEHRRQQAAAYLLQTRETGLTPYENAGREASYRALPALLPAAGQGLLAGLLAALAVVLSRPFMRWLRG